MPLGKPAERIITTLEDAATKEIKQPLENPVTASKNNDEEQVAEDEPFVKTIEPISLGADTLAAEEEDASDSEEEEDASTDEESESEASDEE